MLGERLQETDDIRARSDEEILVMSKTHPSVFEILVDRYQERLLRKARSIMRSPEDAEDIVQDTFTKIYLNADSFQKRDGASFQSWAYKILLNTSFTCYQKRKRVRERTAQLDPEIFEMLPDVESRAFEKYTFSDYISSVVSRMPSDLARALTLHFLEGRPQAEIAEMEGVSVGAIKTRIHRAKKEFRETSENFS